MPAALLPRLLLGTSLLLQSCVLLSQPDAPRLANPALNELSGLAVSHADADLLWGHNDSGAGPILYRIGVDGEDLGSVRIAGVHAVDWEDIAAFDWQGQPALLIADTGDNRAHRKAVTLYAVSDPGRQGTPKLLWQLDFRYPDGPRDCEALAVDPLDGSAILLSKREQPKHLYRLPLPVDRPPIGVAVAEPLAEVSNIPGPTLTDLVGYPGRSAFFGMPTALDISRDGRSAIVVTYKHTLRWRRADGQRWAEAFAATPETLPVPMLNQAEAGAISADGASVFVSSEGRQAPLLRVPLPP